MKTNLVYVIMKAGLGLPDLDAWYMIETIAEKNNIGYTQFVSNFFCFLLVSTQITVVSLFSFYCPLLFFPFST